MGIPTGTEETILRKNTRWPEIRFSVGVTDPQWLGPFEETFDAPLTADKWRFSLMVGAPEVAGGSCLFKSYGVPPFQYIAVRECAIPREATKPFKTSFGLKFNSVDPVYSTGVLMGGPNQYFGVDGDALDVIQEGKAFVAGASIGRINRWSAASEHLRAYTAAVLEYEVLWDGTTLTVKEDGATISTESDPFFVSAPRFWQAGWIHELRVNNPTDEVPWQALGDDVVTPETIMEVTHFKTEENGDGYDDEVMPSYTTAEAGHNIDTAPAYEIYLENGVNWFNLGRDVVLPGTSFIGPSRVGSPTINLILANGDGRFNDDDGWTGRPVRVDVRFHQQGGSPSAWRRIGIYEIGAWSRNRGQVRLSGECRALKRMNAWMSDAFLGLDADSGQVGIIGGVHQGLAINQIIEKALEWAETVSGGPLPAPYLEVLTPSYTVDALDPGGGTVARFVFEDICDRLVQELVVLYETTGPFAGGKIRVALWTNHTPLTYWTVYGKGGADTREMVGDGVEFIPGLEGPGQVFYRWNHPTQANQPLTTARLPFAGQYPSGLYPTSAPELEESAAMLPATSIHPLAPWPDKDGIGRYGGLAKFRYQQENLGRRRISVPLVNIACFEAGDGIAIDTSDAPGLAGEKFVVDQCTYTLGTKNRLYATVEATTTDIVRALRTTVGA